MTQAMCWCVEVRHLSTGGGGAQIDMIDAHRGQLGRVEPVETRQPVPQGGIRVDTRVTVHQLLAGYRAGRLSRRDLLIKSAALGITATALGQLLAREAAAAPLVQD